MTDDATTTTTAVPLDDDKLHAFDRDGFVKLPAFADAGVGETMLDRVVELTRRAADGEDIAPAFVLPEGQAELASRDRDEVRPEDLVSKVFRLARDPVFRDFAVSDRVTAPVAQLLGDPDVDVFLSQFIFKNSGAWGQPWHQDSYYFPFDPPRPVVGVWLAISEATLANGCLHVLPGSHREPIKTHVDDRRPNANYGYVEIVDHDMSGSVPVLMQPGDLLLFDSHLMHRSTDNETDGVRAAMVFHYARAGTHDRTVERKGYTVNDWFHVGPRRRRRPDPRPVARSGAMSGAVVNDGTTSPPRLRVDLHLGTVWDLPAWSAGPARDDDLYGRAADAGFEGIQGGDPVRSAAAGLACNTFGTLREPGGLHDLASLWRDLGFECATLHIGTGHDDEATASQLVTEVLEVSSDLGFPLFVETHRATLTQDLWRTVKLVEQFGELRFNGDFSHWYTGLEMTYGDWDAKVAFIAPVLERTRYLHGRIGDSGCIQIGLAAATEPDSVAHFRQLWTAAALGFLATASAGDVLVFTPELLPPSINYARTEATADGGRDEVSDRWTDALRMADIARDCFAAAQLAAGHGDSPTTRPPATEDLS